MPSNQLEPWTSLAPLDEKKLNLVAQIIRAPLIKFTAAAAQK